jgi:hypothetical protein
LVAAGVSAAVVNSLYQKIIVRREVQKRLDDAQTAYLGAVGSEKDMLDKSAAEVASGGKGISRLEMAGGLPVAAAILLSLASAATTNEMLKKYFPVANRPKLSGPKRIVLRRQAAPPSKEEPSIPAPEEISAASPEEDVPVEKVAADLHTDDSLELVLRLVCEMEKQASKSSGLLDTICALAQGRSREMEQVLENGGASAVFEITKGASAHIQNPVLFSLGVSQAVKDPLWRDILCPVAAASFADMAPMRVKQAALLTMEDASALEVVSAGLGAYSRAEQCEKLAAALPPEVDREHVLQVLEGLVNTPEDGDMSAGEQVDEAQQTEKRLTTLQSVNSEDSEDTFPEGQTEKPKDPQDVETDEIDQVLTAREPLSGVAGMAAAGQA